MKAKRQDSLMQESREHDFHRDTTKSFRFVRQEVEQEQKRTLERMSDDHEKEIRMIREKHSEDKILLKEQLLSRFNQEKEQREECLALSLQKLDFEHKAEVLKRKRENSDKMLELKKLSSELEVRRDQLESQEAALKTRAERLTKIMSYLEGEDKAEERNMKSPPSQVCKEEAKRDQEEKRQLYVSGCQCDVSFDLLKKSNDELRTCHRERENLVTKLDQLQRQYNTLSTRMNEFETSSSRSDVKSSKMLNEEPSYKGDWRSGSPPLSSNVDVEHRARRFLKLEADRLEDLRRKESESPSSRFLSSWGKYRTEYAHNSMVDLNNRGYRY
uniref:Uncharacterized protein n=1 Tax=Knipowitschia caucasica TaxID=637954 RepID=A0AAV2LLK0_KNICA